MSSKFLPTPLTILVPGGEDFNITMSDVAAYTDYGIKVVANYSAQVGATIIVLIFLLLLTKSDKRRSPIFILNGLALVFNIIRTCINIAFFTSAWYYPYAIFAGDYSRITSGDVATQMTSPVMTLLLHLCITLSLVLQVHAVTATIHTTQRYVMLIGTTFVGAVALAFRFALVVVNMEAIQKMEGMYQWQWLASATNITTTISISLFCVAFLSKLGVAQFGPMQIIFIMGCQTLIIPALFSIFQYTSSIPELVHTVLTLVAIFLPLSSLWAGISLPNTHHQQHSGPNIIINNRNISAASAASRAKLLKDTKKSLSPFEKFSSLSAAVALARECDESFGGSTRTGSDGGLGSVGGDDGGMSPGGAGGKEVFGDELV
ncbi:hypothetical protein K402DRAFT_447902 [Aulographum hederae CBS 113979]|uniref:Pheromone alpha factor receptor n=1 Tax=Aulographum hederae CBS 113979 TaxID=1176131 RepID=A0A6G1GT30_9PEZI|nr:hypothetical protein K402DRAFT_447902 [Aulographum hederae CBS 113979]